MPAKFISGRFAGVSHGLSFKILVSLFNPLQPDGIGSLPLSTSKPGLDKCFQSGGTGSWGLSRKRVPSVVSKGPKPPIQLLQLLKNSPREEKRPPFRYNSIGSPGSHSGNRINGARGEGPSRSPPPPPVSPATLETLPF